MGWIESGGEIEGKVLCHHFSMLTSKFGIWSIKRGGKSPKRFFGHIIIIPFSMQSVASALILLLGGDRF